MVSVLGSVMIPRMPVDILPQFKKSAMQVLTLYPGMPSEVVEKDITSRMERWTGQSPGIEKQLSKSIMGVSVVTNFYGEDVSPAEAMANTSAYAMSDMYYQPPGTLPPMVQPFDPTASKPLMLLTVSSETKSGKELYDIAYYNLRQMLSGVKGIIAPAAYGGSLRRIYIFVDPLKLEALGISQTEVNNAIRPEFFGTSYCEKFCPGTCHILPAVWTSIRTLFNSMYVEVDGGVQPADFSISVSGIEFPAYGCPNASSTEPINRSVRKVFIMQL